MLIQTRSTAPIRFVSLYNTGKIKTIGILFCRHDISLNIEIDAQRYL